MTPSVFLTSQPHTRPGCSEACIRLSTLVTACFLPLLRPRPRWAPRASQDPHAECTSPSGPCLTLCTQVPKKTNHTECTRSQTEDQPQEKRGCGLKALQRPHSPDSCPVLRVGTDLRGTPGPAGAHREEQHAGSQVAPTLSLAPQLCSGDAARPVLGDGDTSQDGGPAAQAQLSLPSTRQEPREVALPISAQRWHNSLDLPQHTAIHRYALFPEASATWQRVVLMGGSAVGSDFLHPEQAMA